VSRARCPQPSPTRRTAPTPHPAEAAQSTIEFIGTLPILALAATCCLQALLVALSVVFAQSTADLAARGAPRARAVSSVPVGWRSRISIDASSARVRVDVRPPAFVPGTSRWLVVHASSEVPA
jgi:hypothetical protein